MLLIDKINYKTNFRPKVIYIMKLKVPYECTILTFLTRESLCENDIHYVKFTNKMKIPTKYLPQKAV